ncbi:MAG: 16S rRNA (uracil(1498)-N(3))-methyltransferase [Puniceicoccales bacterium]|jgi:16S rRNA (uracil1498-N3)-methyltransferase|nr:16S rRNA (uracil(1498)-N(3))-methyltransferase [Puniceicoccales bacterium]
MPLFVYHEDTSSLIAKDEVELSRKESHHLFVLRVHEGACVITFDGLGNTRQGILKWKSCNAFVQFTKSVERCQILLPSISLVQVLPNEPATFESVLKKSCELGVHAIYPVLGERTEPKRWTQNVWHCKRARFQRILIDACKQAKNPILPTLGGEIHTLHNIPWASFNQCFYGSLSPSISIQKLTLDATAKSIVCVVGPEGGFAPEEEKLLAMHAQPMRLSSYVLRVETATVSALACLRNLYTYVHI